MKKFNEMSLSEPIEKAIADLNFITPTPIQMETIPWLLNHDTDIIAQAQTGTGKTAAFGLPVLSKTDTKHNIVQTLILCPTRELCIQITKDFESFAKYLPAVKICPVYGGAPIQRQKDQLRGGVHIVVGTPGRVFDMLRQKVLKLELLERLILDEADEMLNMGFKEEIFSIMSHTPANKQTLLFSATMPKEVVEITKTFMTSPHRINVAKQDQGADNIRHLYYKVHARDKYRALKRIADINPKIYGIVFCKTRTETGEIASKLQQDGYNADALHGDLSQAQRDLVMNRFRNKYVQLLVATDVAARGLDVDDLTHIINYEAPSDPDVYIHRSGRTGRAGKSGTSVTIVHIKELNQIKNIERRLGQEITLERVPTGKEICEKQLFNLIDTMENIEVDDSKIDAMMENVYKKLNWLSREELIKRFVSVEFNRFLDYYKDATDLDLVTETNPNKGLRPNTTSGFRNGRQPDKQQDRQNIVFSSFHLNIGYKENLTKRELMKFINRLRVSSGIEIGHIDITANQTVVELDSAYTQPLLAALNKAKYDGNPVQAKVLTNSKEKRFDPARSENPVQRKSPDNRERFYEPAKKRERNKR